MSTYLETARFPRLERQGFMFGMTGGQLGVLAGAGALLMRAVLSQDVTNIVTTILFVAGPLAAFGTIAVQRRALTTITLEIGVWYMRKLLGQTTWKVRPESTVEDHSFGVPGAVGTRISVHRTGFADGALLWDARENTATAVMRVEATSFALASDDDRAGRAAGWAQLCAQVVQHEGVSRVATYARTIPAASAAASDYYVRTSAQRGAGAAASEWADAQYRELLDQGRSLDAAVGVVSRDTLVAITIDANAARNLIRGAGGGKRGMSLVMAREVAALGRLLEEAGATATSWLTAEEVAETIRVAFDPGAVDALEDRRAHGATPVQVPAAGPTVVHEEVDHLVTDTGLHQTFWVAEWPRTEVPIGFLANLLCRGTYAHTFTQVFTPVPLHKALKDVADARMGIESQMNVNTRLGRPITAEMRASLDDVMEREQELTQGFGDVRFTGYLTISAPTEDGLGAARAEALMAASQLDLRLLKRQQAAAFTAAALPIGWGLK
ncbi:hypothetical protein HF995_13440 [Sanguibacter hominis ATCC BAA-789]|uniref:PrgI family protein n=1 Tax=Sanguibacter hominis ATCC BAA-789 TaxID=1312740 RepID=A0A9X5FD84_9MICO|nr:hypothetical protein [Sanguibacter hominis ATCC BAA-789]